MEYGKGGLGGGGGEGGGGVYHGNKRVKTYDSFKFRDLSQKIRT